MYLAVYIVVYINESKLVPIWRDIAADRTDFSSICNANLRSAYTQYIYTSTLSVISFSLSLSRDSWKKKNVADDEWSAAEKLQ